MSPADIKMGQEWYFFSSSTTYIVYKIEQSEYRYRDGEVLESDVVIHLRGSNNTTIIKHPEDFSENNCKLIKDNVANVPVSVTIIPVPLKNRLDTVE